MRSLPHLLLLTIYLISPTFSTSTETLHLTALTSHPKTGNPQFECWRLTQPFTTYPTIGKAITGLADVSNLSYVVLPPRSSEGVHNAPHPMFFVLLSGLAHVTLPPNGEGGNDGSDDADELWIMEGVNGLMIAADTWGPGHVTDYPSDKETVALQIPLLEGRMPEHEVVGRVVCGVEGKEGGVGGGDGGGYGFMVQGEGW